MTVNRPDPKRLRTLFIDDAEVPAVTELRHQGYDVEQIFDVTSLDELCSGRYHLIFFDVRGVGEKLGKNGLDILKFVAQHNPLVYRVAYSAKPFEPSETELLVRYADRSMKKDLTIVEFIDVIDDYARSLTHASVINRIERYLTLTWWQRRSLSRKQFLTEAQIAKVARASGIAADATKIVSNIVTISKTLFALASI